MEEFNWIPFMNGYIHKDNMNRIFNNIKLPPKQSPGPSKPPIGEPPKK